MTDTTIVIASNNVGKLNEFQHLFSATNVVVRSQGEFNVPEADENGLSFIENAIIKARNAAFFSGCAALADDSGLEVDVLNGGPGIYSARFSQNENGQRTNDSTNIVKLLSLLKDTPDEQRSARFVCALAFMRHDKDPTPVVCVGTWEGQILRKEVGNNGFGYDPVFYVPEFDCASAELEPEIKNKNSHRGKALAIMMQQLSGLGLID